MPWFTRHALALFIVSGAAAPALALTDGEIGRLLLVQAWCGSAHDRSLGYTIVRSARFTPDGVLIMASTREGGDPVGPEQAPENQDPEGNEERYFWRVQNGMLALSDDQFTWEFLELDANRDAGGQVTLSMDGAEWTACP
jgi:hypothetical protein